VPALGFGAMGLSAFYGSTPSDEKNHELIKLAVDLGASFIDTADCYGPPMGLNERLLGGVLKDPEFRKKVFICTKFGIILDNGSGTMRSDAAYVRQQCEESLKNLQVDYIDLYYQHRVDRSIPIEETWRELKKLQEEGKVKYLGISEATSDEIRRAHAITKISALQIEFSPWTPDIRENGILDTCRELGISIVAYSPLGRGFLTGAYKSPEDFEPGDFRRWNPRLQGEAFKENLKLVDALKELAEKKGCTSGQLALAWVLAQGNDFITIPGTKKEKYLRENMGALDVQLTTEDLAVIDELTQKIKAVGARYGHDGGAAF